VRRKVVARLALLTILVAGCSFASCVAGIYVGRSASSKSGIIAAIFGQEPELPQVGETLFQDDFEDPNSGWLVSSDDEVERGYQNGKYDIVVKVKNSTFWSTVRHSFRDFSLEVDATEVGGPDENSYGVIFRYQDDDNFYIFEISGDGYYAVTKVVDGEWIELVGWRETTAIKTGRRTNVLRVVCIGPEMEFYINGEKQIGTNDKTFSQGEIGLSAGAFNRKDVHVQFDNLRVVEILK
jgi:hypothetical protein